MTISASELRQNIYKLLDEVLETGRPLEVERKGKLLRIWPAETESRLHRLDSLPRRSDIIGDPEDLVHIDWSQYWNPDEPI